MFYIQFRQGKELETVDEFSSYKEAKAMLKEYRLASRGYGEHYISRRCCKHWRDK